MTMLDILFPREASNDYRGGRVPLYTFGVLTTVMLGRSLIHFLKDDSGVNSIATIVLFSGSPDPNRAIYMYSALWGTQQLITAMIFIVVLVRYRNLVHLMYVVLCIELCFRMTVGILHPLGDDYFVRTPPGMIGNVPALVLSASMLFWSLRTARGRRSQ